MADYLKAQSRINEIMGGAVRRTPDREEDFYIDKNVTLNKNDL